MKNKVLLISAGLLLFIFLVFGTYAWYLFFLRASANFPINDNAHLKDGDIALLDKGNNVYETDAESMEDEDIMAVTPYLFKVKNTSSNSDNYTLYIEDIPLNLIQDGCTSETLLTRDMLKYELRLNGKIIKKDYLSKIRDNILDERSIEADMTNEYELRIYIHEYAEDWGNKHYHYKVVINN